MTSERSSEKTSQHIAGGCTLTIQDNAAGAAPTGQEEVNTGSNLPWPQPPEQYRREAWNIPRSNIGRVAACFWSLLMLGFFDAAYGVLDRRFLIPQLQEFYQVSYTVISIVFFAPLAGYVLSGILNTRLHNAVGQRGIALLCGGSHLISALINCLHPPYPLLVISFMVAGLGNGLSDSAWNAWIGNLPRATELLGFMHACYGVGAVISPLIATAMITRAHLPWFTYYYVMIGLSSLEMFALTASFWAYTGACHRARVAKAGEGQPKAIMRKVLTTLPEARSAWLSALFVLVYVGVEVSLGGWVVEFMLVERNGAPFASGMVATGYWLGITAGRGLLPFVTNLLGIKVAITCYLILTISLELVFWLVPKFVVSAVAVAFQGFFIGPLFPTAITAVTKLLPTHLHVVVIGFVAALGGCGASVLPFAVGALAQRFGVMVLQPVIIGLLGLSLVIWLSLPKIPAESTSQGTGGTLVPPLVKVIAPLSC
ncbi:major facilitator superfamily domain-containing protein [Diaporthe sp. PMI_573]|nr:major facilitator superfamily domain-containing protein [Diaporthaceae sp. PMI_573]